MSLRHLVTLLTALVTLGSVPAAAAADPPPPKFTVNPEVPFEDQLVTFTAQANCADKDVVCVWTGQDGIADRGQRITHTYANPGTYLIRLDVVRRKSNGSFEIEFRIIAVQVSRAPPPPPPPPPPLIPVPVPPVAPTPAPPAPGFPVGGTGSADAPPASPVAPPAAGSPEPSPTPAAPAPAATTDPEPRATPPTRPATEPRIMSPFPIVRIAGTVGSSGTRLTLFSVRGPRTARVIVRCVGRNRGCPFRRREHLVRASLSQELKLRGRLLRPGAVLDIRVFQAGRVGKRTTLRFRDRRGPTRTDGCVTPAGGVRRCG